MNPNRLSAYDLSMLAYEARKSPLKEAILALIEETRMSRDANGEDVYIPVGYRVPLDRNWFMEHRGDDHWSRGFSL